MAYRVLSAEFLLSVREFAQLAEVPAMGEVAFAGRSNVGKSSLLNALTNHRSLARTSKTPGRTAALNYFKVRWEELEQTARFESAFVDLPGFGFARVSHAERELWANLIERYLLERESLVACLVLIDSRRGAQDEELWFSTLAPRVQVIPVLTKSDKLKQAELAAVRKDVASAFGLDFDGVVVTSAEKGFGIGPLTNRLGTALFGL